MRLAKPILGGLACLLAVGLLGSASARATPVISGINGFSLYAARQVGWPTQLAAIRGNGVTVVRSDAPWAGIEPLPPGPLGPIYDFSLLDAWVNELALNHLTWQPILDYTTSWGGPIAEYPAFQGYVQAVVSRYGAGGSFWSQNPELPYLPAHVFELWNEENTSQWYIPAHDYAALYQGLHTAVHAIDQSATLIVGGLGTQSPAQDPVGYVQAMLAAKPDLKGNIDGFGLHPYTGSGTANVQLLVQFRHALSLRGMGSVPIYLSEFGWPYFADRESWRADQMRSMASLVNSDCGVGELAPYDWINPQPGGGTDFGFVDTSGLDTTLRPAGSAWFTALGHAASQRQTTVCNPTKAKPKPKKHKKKRKKKKKHPGHGGKHHPKPGHH